MPNERSQAAGQCNDTFISYRRDTSGALAMSLFHHLKELGVDCFYDIESLRAGQFEKLILGQIAARPYFILVLSPGCLVRCEHPEDWFRREIEEAIRLERTIVPVFSDNFEFSEVDHFLPGRLAANIKGHNGLPIPQRYFKYAVQQLAEEWLVPVEAAAGAVREPSAEESQVVETMIKAAMETDVSPDEIQEEAAYGRFVKTLRDAEPTPPPPPPRPDEPGYSGTQTAKIVGLTYRQLDYWARTDLLRPSLVEATGSGSRRRYSYRDLLELRVIKTLLDAGIRLESVREVFTYLRSHVTKDIAAAHIVISGDQIVLCDGDELVDVLRHGEGTLYVLPLAGVKDDIDAQLVPLSDDSDNDDPNDDGPDGGVLQPA